MFLFLLKTLKKKFDHWIQHNLAEENEAAYLNFLERFNYPFDGKAAQRVIEALTGVTVMKTEAVQPL